jgi:DNA polymerase
MKNVVVDFESFYDKEISITTMGLPNYVAATDAYLVSVVSNDLEFCGSPADLLTHTGNTWMGDPNIQFWAANANFDQKLWEKYCPHTPRPWKCILDLAAFHQLPRDLASVCRVVLGVKLDKSVRDDMKGVRFESLPDKEQERVQKYCLDDSLNEMALLNRLAPMSPVEDEVAAHTRMVNRRGVHIDTDKVQEYLSKLEMVKHEALKQLPWAEDSAPLSYPAFSEYVRARGSEPPASLDKRNALCVAWMEQNPQLAELILSMRMLRGSNAKLKKLRKLMANLHNGILPLELLYCGARHTRRWSSKGFNVQNLDKKPVFADVLAGMVDDEEVEDKEVGVFMRHCLVPPPGCDFGIIDYSQVEPRCLNWIAQNDELLDAIRKGYSYYEAYAGLYKGWRGGAGTIKQSFKDDAYTKLKNEAIGLGYGMGAGKYSDYAKVSAEEAEHVVAEFRRQNPKIVALWRRYDSRIRAAALQNDRHLAIEMATGDLLQHFNVRSKADGGGFESFTIKGDFSGMSKQPRMWGGTLAENVTQRMARDIMADAVLRLEKAGFPVIFHAHDEIVLALSKATSRNDLKEAERLMAQPPEWCADLPLGVEGNVFPHYTKM